MPIFGDLFKKNRDNKKYSQKYVAEKIGVSQSYISQIERGTRIPTLKFVEKVWEELGFELMIINIDQEKELLMTIINQLKPFDVKRIVYYAQRICEVKNG